VRYRTPQDSAARWRVSDWGQPSKIGGVRASLGDIVVGDLDGVVIVPRRVAAEVPKRAEPIDHGEFVDANSGKAVFSYAHPIFWVPFTLIGDGGTDPATR
jgi:hypothetical protein